MSQPGYYVYPQQPQPIVVVGGGGNGGKQSTSSIVLKGVAVMVAMAILALGGWYIYTKLKDTNLFQPAATKKDPLKEGIATAIKVTGKVVESAIMYGTVPGLIYKAVISARPCRSDEISGAPTNEKEGTACSFLDRTIKYMHVRCGIWQIDRYGDGEQCQYGPNATVKAYRYPPNKGFLKPKDQKALLITSAVFMFTPLAPIFMWVLIANAVIQGAVSCKDGWDQGTKCDREEGEACYYMDGKRKYLHCRCGYWQKDNKKTGQSCQYNRPEDRKLDIATEGLVGLDKPCYNDKGNQIPDGSGGYRPKGPNDLCNPFLYCATKGDAVQGTCKIISTLDERCDANFPKDACGDVSECLATSSPTSMETCTQWVKTPEGQKQESEAVNCLTNPFCDKSKRSLTCYERAQAVTNGGVCVSKTETPQVDEVVASRLKCDSKTKCPGRSWCWPRGGGECYDETVSEGQFCADVHSTKTNDSGCPKNMTCANKKDGPPTAVCVRDSCKSTDDCASGSFCWPKGNGKCYKEPQYAGDYCADTHASGTDYSACPSGTKCENKDPVGTCVSY
jgi:hypothetical protein